MSTCTRDKQMVGECMNEKVLKKAQSMEQHQQHQQIQPRLRSQTTPVSPCAISYRVVWPAQASLGASFARAEDQHSTIINSIDATAKMPGQCFEGKTAAQPGDFLVQINNQNTSSLDFPQVIQLLQTTPRPVLLGFASSSTLTAKPVLPSNGLAPVCYDVLYNGGKLGLVLIAGNTNKKLDSFPVVYKVTDACSAQGLEEASKGDELIAVDGVDTRSLGFKQTVSVIQQVNQPTILRFQKRKHKASVTGLIFEVMGAMFV